MAHVSRDLDQVRAGTSRASQEGDTAHKGPEVGPQTGQGAGQE